MGGQRFLNGEIPGLDVRLPEMHIDHLIHLIRSIPDDAVRWDDGNRGRRKPGLKRGSLSAREKRRSEPRVQWVERVVLIDREVVGVRVIRKGSITDTETGANDRRRGQPVGQAGPWS